MEQLKNDAEFLQQNNIIDYSMLFGIHKKGVRNVSSEKRNSTVNSYLLSSYNSFAPKALDNVNSFDIYIFRFSIHFYLIF